MGRSAVPFGIDIPRVQKWLIAAALIALAFAQIAQPYPGIAPLHHLPTLAILLAAPFLLTRWKLSNAAVLCIVAFLALHTIGGRYTYTNTPYDAWFDTLTGQSLNELMGWSRNHYDRLVHFSFGLLSILPAIEILERYAKVSRRLALYIAVEFVMGISAIYEIFEWGLSVMLSPENVEAYNGQQGDFWDAQKDMALAFCGALIASFIAIVRRSLVTRETQPG